MSDGEACRDIGDFCCAGAFFVHVQQRNLHEASIFTGMFSSGKSYFQNLYLFF